MGNPRHELLAQQPVIVKAQLEVDDVPNEGVQLIPPPRLPENRRGRRPHHVIAGKRPHRRRLQRHTPPVVPGEGGRVQFPRRTQILGRRASHWSQPIAAVLTARFHSKMPLYHAALPKRGNFVALQHGEVSLLLVQRLLSKPFKTMFQQLNFP